MYDPIDFYKFYQVDHFTYKATTLKNILDNYSALKHTILDGLEDIIDKDYMNTLRAEMRATYYQAVETLFELIFALEPEDGRLVDRELWFRLSDSRNFQKRYMRICDIAEGAIQFLDTPVVLNYRDGGEKRVSLLQFLFYFIADEDSWHERMVASFPATKKALTLFAKDFSDRDMYNAIKHGIRLFPYFEAFRLELKGEKHGITLNLKDSLSYMKHEDDGSLSVYGRKLDFERDFNMTLLCNVLISNIIRIRRLKLFPKDDVRVPIIFLSDEDVDYSSQSHASPESIRFNSYVVSSQTTKTNNEANTSTL